MNRQELDLMIQEYLEGSLSPENELLLLEHLEQSQQARDVYLQYAQLDTLLHESHTDPDKGQLPQSAHPPVETILQRQRRKAFWLSSGIGIAASLLLATVFYFISVEGADEFEMTQSPGTVITISRSPDNENQDLADHQLRSGDRVRLEQGCVELTFPKKDRALVQAPAEFTLLSDNVVDLKYGKIWVSTTSPGFIVNTPELKATDLGTVFAVDSSENEHDEVHVVSGSVRVASHLGKKANRQTVEITAKEALRSDGIGGLVSIQAQADKFYTELPDSLPHIHYSFDRVTMRGNREFSSEGLLATSNMRFNGKAATAFCRQAHRSEGVYFDHVSSNLVSDWKGVSSNQPRTVMMWINPRNGLDIPVKSVPTPIVYWGDSGGVTNKKWKIALLGPSHKKRVRVSLGSTWHDSEYCITPDQWHHVAVSYSGKTLENGELDLKIYVDGKEVPWKRLGHPPVGKLHVDTAEKAPLRIGPLNGENKRNHLNAIDELYIFEGVLGIRDIQTWMQK